MMIAKFLTAMSTALVVVLSLTIAAKIVNPLSSKSIRINLYGY